jgi:uncharacterized repeat protein (TIGR01451 family)
MTRKEGRQLDRRGRQRVWAAGIRIGLLLCSLVLLLGSASAAQAADCSDYPGGILDGFAGGVAPSQIQVDRNCTIRNFPASNPLGTNFSFKTQPGQTDERWLIIFDNVVHTGQMACNSVAGHIIWFTNGSSTSIQDGCQNLLIPVEKVDKQNPAGTTTATVGVPFTYSMTIPVLFDPGTGTVINAQGSPNDLHTVRLTDNLNETGAALSYVSHVAYWRDSLAPVPHTFSNVGGLLTFENFPIVPAGDQIVIELTVVLDDSPANTLGTQFINTAKWDFGRLIDGVFYEPLPGEWGISPPLTIAAPDLQFTKTGPPTLNLGATGDFTLDIRNAGTSDAFNATIVDQLPDGASGGMCDVAPTITSAQVFAADGTTPVAGKGPLSAGQYALSFVGAPTCELTLTVLSDEGAIGQGERLIIDYQAELDTDTQNGASLTNVAGATEWFNGDSSNPSRIASNRTLTNGTVGTVDHEDAHTVTTALTGLFFEKSVQNLTSGANPASAAAPGDVLRYSLRLQTTDSALNGFTFFDDMGALNATPVFAPGTLALVAGTIPPGADTSSTNPAGGTNGAGIVDIRNLSLPANSEVVIEFDITLALGLADGLVVTNQAGLIDSVATQIADSDDPNINGQADPNVPGDEDPTRVVIVTVPAPALQKAITQATASVGERFRYRITVPETPHVFDLFDVVITDDLLASAADLRFVDVTKVSGSGAWTPVNIGTSTNPVIADPTIGIDIPAGEQIEIELTVVLENTPTNIPGLMFTNTAGYLYNPIDGIGPGQQPGPSGTSAPMTIVEPDDFEFVKSGPVAMAVGTPGVFTLDAQNVGTGSAWNLRLTDQLPDGATGGLCDGPPAVQTAQVFAADGTTPVSGALSQGTDYAVGFSPAPVCQFEVSLLSAAGVVGPTERFIVTFEAQLDADTTGGATLDNIAGATEWFSADVNDPVTGGDARQFNRGLSDGTPTQVDHEDVHSFATALPEVFFEKTVVNVTTGQSPAASASPGDTLRYTLRVENLATIGPASFSLVDDLDILNVSPVFEPGTLVITSAPPGADTTPTNPNSGTAGTGLVDVRGLGLQNLGDIVTVEFEVQLAAVIPTGTLATNQSELRILGQTFVVSDDPAVNGQADPFIPGDEDPTVVPILSASDFLVLKTSTDLDGDPNVLLAGERLRYTITVENVGTSDATDAMLRDALPVNTAYIAGSATLNGVAIPGATLPLESGVPINALGDPTPGAMPAMVGEIATLTFDVTVDPAAPDGTIISNQAFVSAVGSGTVDQPSDDPDTSAVDDPTRDVVGNAPLLFAPKAVAIGIDGGTIGQVDPGDTLHYTITVYNDGNIPATAANISDVVPANTTWVADSLRLNTIPVGVPDGGVSPLAAGIPIASSDQTPPPPAGGGVLSPGENAVIEFDLLVDAGVPSGTVISNQAIVATAEVASLPTDGDGNPSTGPEPTIVIVGDAQSLAITKTVAVVGGGPALAGGQLDYLVRVTNVASVSAQTIVLTDDLDAPVPGQLTLVPGSATLDGLAAGITVVGSVITADWSTLYGALAPGDSIVLRFRVDINAGLPIGTPITNTGVVTWDTPTQMAMASVTIALGGSPGIGVLSGALWHDANFDRVQGAGERALDGWSVDLYRNGQVSQSVLSDASGAYQMTGIAPNDLNGDVYELRFRAPDAGPNTAALGVGDSLYTNGPQAISGILIAGGSNQQNLNLPIDPQGVVYESLLRTPLSGSSLSLLDASSQAPVAASCFDDPNQQGQITGTNGYYKFSLNFSDASCPDGGDYLIEVAPPDPSFASGVSQVIPPQTDSTTAPFDVPTCPGGPADAIGVPAGFCEIQVSELAPDALTAPANSPATNYYLHVTLDSSLGAGSSQAFNNHLPIDSPLAGAVAISKTTPAINVSRGDLVPYTITFTNTLTVPLTDYTVRDLYPAGFKYIQGSARLDDIETEPAIAGRELTWVITQPLLPNESRTIVLLLGVGAGVTEGEFVNRAQILSSSTAQVFSGEASATVRVVPDPTFDCTDVIGKVYDDADRDGEQDPGEHGLSGVRLMTMRGLAVTTDQYGRFHVTCAVVPDETRGSNFVLKLDDRTLPSGYRMSTRQIQVKRATRGKALKFQFGASIDRVVALDLADAVFAPGESSMRVQWEPRLAMLLDELEKKVAILRLSYLADLEDAKLVDERLEAVKKQILDAWEQRDAYPLTIETEIFWRGGAPAARPASLPETSSTVSALPHVGAGPPGWLESGASSTEQHLSTDEPMTEWVLDPDRLSTDHGDRLESREVVAPNVTIVKLKDVVLPIRFDSGVADISPAYISKLKSVLLDMRHLENVRLHLVGHTDDQSLSPALARIYEDNVGLSRERAGEVAEFLQTALGLPPESIAFDWVGDTEPVAPNTTDAGRALNRRVEVEVWYDEIDEKTAFEDVVIQEDIKRFKVCRTETLCKLRYREGHARRARIKNLIPPLHYGDSALKIDGEFIRQIEQALFNLRSKQNVTVKFIGSTDDVPLEGREERIYGTHLALSKARAHRVALAIKDALDLETSGIASDGRGASRPLASNATDRGRGLNRRIEVEFWHDDPLQEMSDELQMCPDPAGAEWVAKVYDPPWGRFEPLAIEEGQPVIPSGYAESLRRAMDDVEDEKNVRLRFVGYTRNERLDRRTAEVYGDDIGLSAARARRTMESIQTELELTDAQAEHEGRGFVHSDDVVNGGFLQGDTSHVVVQVVYDELAVLDDYDGVEVTPVTRELRPQNPLSLNLMRITVDGEPIDDPGRNSADIQRCTDVALDKADIQFQFDDLESDPRLSVTSEPSYVRISPDSGAASPVRFQMYSNYAHFFERGEVRLFEQRESLRSEPLDIVELDRDGRGTWAPKLEAASSPVEVLKFVLRVYAVDGSFDETAPQPLWVTPGGASESGELADLDALVWPTGEAGASFDVEFELPNEGESRLASEDEAVVADTREAAPTASAYGVQEELLGAYGEAEPVARNIALDGVGSVVVKGKGIPANHTVWVAGTPVPVDDEGNFVGEVLLPTGLHTVEVAVLDDEGNGELFLRDLEFEQNEWFYMAIADLTLSADLTNGPSDQLAGNKENDQDSFADGRIAFYTTGKFGTDWKLTATADTREGPVEDIFTNFLDKAPDSLFRRLDPDYHYSTFGDDGTVEETAPTLGKFYVKLNKGDDHLMWGNFLVNYHDNELALVERGLYGANARYQTDALTRFGERRAALDGFAADSGTVPSRDEFRGTGGSLYFLQRRDLLIGSDRVRVEVRDKASGLVSEVVYLQPELDYDIDYIQGRILLNEPLSTIASDRLLVRNDGLSGDEVWLVAQYEYTPGFDEIDALNTGGQGHYWLTDFMKLGLTANKNEEGDVDSSLYAANLTLRKTTDSWIKLQAGRSDGLASTSVLSNDGGFNFVDPNALNPDSVDAFGYRADFRLEFSDFIEKAGGHVSLYGQRLEAGYSAPGLNTMTDTNQYGGVFVMPLVKMIRLTAKADRVEQDRGLETTTAEVDVGYDVTKHWSVEVGVRHDDRDAGTLASTPTQEEGDRTDGVVQVGYDSKGKWNTYAFGQATIQSSGQREDNNRGGVGGAFRINDQIAVDGEVSHGDLGPAAKVGTSYQKSERSRLYLNYALNNERSYDGLNARRGNLVAGTRSRLSDSTSVYVENQYQHATISGLTRAMGIDFKPTERWSLGASWENGKTRDRQTHAETKRRGASASAGYVFKSAQISSAVEYVFAETEQFDGTTSDRTTWLFRNNLNIQLTPDWRMLAKANHAMSDSSEGEFFDGGFTEAVIGYAFRPVRHDKLNTLAKYTYFYNVPSTDQANQVGVGSQFIQKSHVAALDVTYDLTKSWTIGAKYAYRLSQVSLERENPDFFDNDAHLVILRGDWRFMKNWEGSLEGRMLDLPDLDERRAGALVTLYRYLGENMKVGIGYNFTDFSEDLTDLEYDHHGVFFNMIGTF